MCRARLRGRLVAAGAVATAALAAAPVVAFAHAGGAAAGGADVATALRTWPWSDGAAVALLLGAPYAVGLWRLRGAAGARGRASWGDAAYLAGVAVAALAVGTPLDGMGDAVFSMHMTQHLVLMLVAAPLLAAGRPAAVLAWALPPAARPAVRRALRPRAPRRACRALTRLPIAATVFTCLLWAWHAPALFDAAVAHDAVHAVEHACFLGSAWLFWHAYFREALGGGNRAAGALTAAFLVAAQASVLAALLTFSAAPWYAPYATPVAGWPAGPLADQQLGGLLMWIPSNLFFIGASAAAFLLWIRAAERDARRTPPAGRPAATRGEVT